MAKNLARSKSVMSRFRGRDAASSSASLHVTDDAQANAIPTSTSQKFETGREDRHKLPERPSTSGGTKKSTGSFPKRANTVKRETRDDLFFNPLTAHGIDGPTFYNFPLPSTRPPTSPVAPQMVEPILRPQTPDSIETDKTAHHNVSEAEIGMALGSPAHSPDDWQQAQKTFEEETVTTPRPVDDVSHYDDSIVAPKQKKGRKWFGLFGSKREKATNTFYQLKPESQDIPAIETSSPEVKRNGRSRGRSTSSKTAKKPDMKRSQTAPITPGIQHPFQASTSTNIPAGTPDIRVQGPIGVEVLRSYPTVSPEGPKLDLAIPSVQMERYSVMFEDILQKPPTNTSSLLQRRQATLDRLKSVEETLATKEAELEARTKALTTRRANSPPPHQNSPSFSLFPATPSRQDNRESSPTGEKLSLYRSNTSPAGFSPARPLFAPGLDNDLHADIVFDNKTPANQGGHEHKDSSSSTSTKKPVKHSTRSPSSSPKIKPQLQIARTWSPDKSQLLSPSSTEDSEADARSTNGQEIEKTHIASSQTSFKSKVEEKESAWQMVNSKKQNHHAPSSISGSTTSEASTVSSSHSTASFSSQPGGIITNTVPILKQEKVRERGSRKASSTNNQSPQKDKETKISVKSTLGPRPIISAFNTTTRTSDFTSRPILQSPISEPMGFRSHVLTSRPSIQISSSSTSHASNNSPRPSLQQSPMFSTNFSSTNISSPRKIPLPRSPYPQRPTITTLSPQPEPSYNNHQKQESTSSITPSLFDVQIDDALDLPSTRSRDPEQKRLESAAGVSIARQISVSRQQRQLLIPIKTSGTISKRNPRDRSPNLKNQSERNENSPVVAKKVVTGDDVTAKVGSPLESVSELSLRGGVLSPGRSQSGGEGRGEEALVGGKREILVKQGWKPSTPTLVVVPGLDEQWGRGARRREMVRGVD
ncbi:hypothetical protein EYC80_010886 [Monilinia laxa]|uniref:Uncharacterized protein n=1 Tax=Monilinia laxa TaxID=61186 RepID=A0A5N6JR38_MONLA|nr:hypothetical protein EYC80_010886 [Monilinia laxa]